ncbi:FAD-dependent monooxygenase [Streptomyces flavofungini]|nr:FAD-dependent monooxygenase [Streptomyces flavofungini]WJV46612.1 FAD-dependent monooxygenase [Streptomyces flavofungini]
MTPTTEVLVVGAGPTGLTLACDLARRGVRALVVERAAGLFPGSRGKGVQPRTLEVFDDLGVAGAILAAGGAPPVGMVWQGGEQQGEYRMFDEPEPTDSAPYAGPVLVPQWRTQEILYARLTELGGSVAFGTEVTGITQDADGVTARLAGGGTVRAAYVVAADGGRSAVRRALGIGMTGETVDPQPMLVADIRIADGALDRNNWHVFPPPGTHPSEGAASGGDFAAICPLPGIADFQLVARFTGGAEPDLSPDGVREAVAARTHLAAADVTEVRWASDFRPRAALADTFRAGRVLLAGDAAHVHSPAGGQGLNTSVQDAYNLGWKLGAVLRHGADAGLLDTYEEERRAVAARMLELSTRIHHGTDRRGAATRQLGLGYRDSSLSLDTSLDTSTATSDTAPRAGDRAPDAPLGAGRLFDALRGPHFTLLAVATDAELPPLNGEMARVRRTADCAPYGPGLHLIRPDGYIAWTGQDEEGLRKYLTSTKLEVLGSRA